MIAGDRKTIPEIVQRPFPAAARHSDGTLSVLTLNIAHGRADGRHQALQRTGRIRSNLDDVADLLDREGADVVALQEADAPSVWSGRFDHVGYVAEQARYPFATHGYHVNGFKLAYGTALMASRPLTDPMSITFKPSPPTMPKGFVVAQVPWPGRPELAVDVVSVHLDFSRASVRRQQVGKIVRTLAKRDRPLVVMGDFNCTKLSANSSLAQLIQGLDLRAHRADANYLVTFPSNGKRLDWILISPELTFEDYQVLDDQVSDHLGVMARIGLTEPGESHRRSAN